MATVQTIYGQNHRRQQLTVLVLSLFAVLLSVVPHEERALFVVAGRPLKAFGAAFPALSPTGDANAYSFGAPGPFSARAFFARPPVGTSQPNGALAPAGPFVPAGAGVAPSPDAATPGAGSGPSVSPAATGVGGGGGGGIPFFPTAIAPPGSDPVGTTATAAVTPAIPVVPGVPEPSTWFLMILGLGLVGAAIRYRGLQSKAI